MALLGTGGVQGPLYPTDLCYLSIIFSSDKNCLLHSLLNVNKTLPAGGNICEKKGLTIKSLWSKYKRYYFPRFLFRYLGSLVRSLVHFFKVVIDAGSSGSRVYIMYWPPHTGSKTELLQIKQMIDMDGNPVRKKIKPGISSYARFPGNASESLRPLLDFAAHHVPRRKHRETPLYILGWFELFRRVDAPEMLTT